MERTFVKTYTVTKAASGTGFATAVECPELGREGVIDTVTWREDATSKDATSIDTYIIDDGGTLAAAPTRERVRYQYTGLTVAGHATSGYTDSPGDVGGAHYKATAPGNVKINFNATAVGGGGTGTIMYITLTGRVKP